MIEIIDIPNFVTLFYGAIILGVGYFGLWFKYKIEEKDFYKLKPLDKVVQSLNIGVISFLVTLMLVNVPTAIISTEEQLLSYLLNKRWIIFLDYLVVFYLIISFKVFESLFVNHFGLDKLRRGLKSLKENKKIKEKKPT